MAYINLTIEFTPSHALSAVVAAGGTNKNQDAVLSVIDQSRMKIKVGQNNIRNWIAEMTGYGYQVVDAEIPVTEIY